MQMNVERSYEDNLMNEFELDIIDNGVKIADETRRDRNEFLQRVARNVDRVVRIANLSEYQPDETVTEKHWNECMQIAHYDNQIKAQQEHIDRLRGIIDGLCGYLEGEGR